MAIFNVYNLYDQTTETFILQFISTHDKLIKRDMENLYLQAKRSHDQNPTSVQGSIYRYASEYDLYRTATFDDKTGIYTPLDVKVHVLNMNCFADEEQAKTEVAV